ncbi:MAG: HAD family hydrolase [Saprospiraceae bacterium]|nr:HAD family hydrolase [Saprospiraceae bacterium]MBK6567100.1 HAD family hydrolase [Saprospiraceae bacterium]MBK8081479.1 HAD family hydrolase [Saprospiraceae bacterium]MBK8372562.1 HAD family hydrolase [Saprospiraceae bacterium]MBK8549442.1 HAD family hydrolase [Saprospiraceae bacterium]
MRHRELDNIKVIGFDADDTLWINEPFFRENEERFCDMLEPYCPRHDILKHLLTIEIRNMELYGYGVKAFVLSMIETAIEISGETIPNKMVKKIMEMGKEQLEMPVELLPSVRETLKELKQDYRLVMVTKGDLLDQERKLKKSSLTSMFHHIEIVSDKREGEYQKIINHLDILPQEFMMVGNSLKSDVIPALAIDAFAVHVPFHTTWIHEMVDVTLTNDKFFEIEKIEDLLPILKIKQPA